MSVQLRNFTAAAALAVLTACGGGKPSGDGGNQVLNVWNWSDYIEPDLIAEFEAETGIKVNYEVGDSNEMLETKLLAGRTGYDLVVPSASFMARQIQAGIFQKLDKSKLSNYGNLDPAILKNLAALDPGNEYSVNYMWGTSGIAYIPERINEAMPNAPVDSFAMFYDPNVIKNFEKCGVSILDAASEVVGTVLIYLGRDANSESLEDLKAAEDLERIRLLFADLEAQKDMIDLLSRAEEGEGVRIFIGSENKLFSMSGSSMIAAPFRDSSQQIVGVVGVIGPTRLNYARIVPMVDYTAQVVSRLLEGR